MRNLSMNRFTLTVAISLVLATAGCQFDLVHANSDPEQASRPDQDTLTIDSGSALPDTHPDARYELQLFAHGGAGPYHWNIERGALPQGITLAENGALHGSPKAGGEFQFTVIVRDRMGQVVRKQFTIRVVSALMLNWKAPAHVNGSRIEGSVEVSNTTADDVDLTFVVMAVATLNSRGTAIGYQHFVLPKGTTGKELPFGETLPHGGYVVHVDAVGEVAPKKLIYRERLQTPGALNVDVGP